MWAVGLDDSTVVNNSVILESEDLESEEKALLICQRRSQHSHCQKVVGLIPRPVVATPPRPPTRGAALVIGVTKTDWKPADGGLLLVLLHW